jgi:hypothetical protein
MKLTAFDDEGRFFGRQDLSQNDRLGWVRSRGLHRLAINCRHFVAGWKTPHPGPLPAIILR